jgi:hypothetical protein
MAQQSWRQSHHRTTHPRKNYQVSILAGRKWDRSERVTSKSAIEGTSPEVCSMPCKAYRAINLQSSGSGLWVGRLLVRRPLALARCTGPVPCRSTHLLG